VTGVPYSKSVGLKHLIAAAYVAVVMEMQVIDLQFVTPARKCGAD
jgi:hypothetical protein